MTTVEDEVQTVERRSIQRILAMLWQKYYIVVIFFAMVVVSSFIDSKFLSFANISNVLKQQAVPGIVALGELIVILTAGIDLSVGSLVALTGVLAVGLQRDMPLVPAVLLALLVGLGGGLISGLLISKRNIPPFIATLGMMAIARGLTYIYTHGGPIQITYKPYEFLGRGMIGPVPFIVIMWVIITAIMWVVLRRTTFGRTTLAIGSNPVAVYLSGINVSWHLLVIYALSGLLCAIGGILLSSRLTIGTPLMGESMELDAIAAVVIGGASLSGGRGNVWGTIIGVLILGMISNMLNLVGVSMFYQDAVRGAIIVLAVLFKAAQDK